MWIGFDLEKNVVPKWWRTTHMFLVWHILWISGIATCLWYMSLSAARSMTIAHLKSVSAIHHRVQTNRQTLMPPQPVKDQSPLHVSCGNAILINQFICSDPDYCCFLPIALPGSRKQGPRSELNTLTMPPEFIWTFPHMFWQEGYYQERQAYSRDFKCHNYFARWKDFCVVSTT